MDYLRTYERDGQTVGVNSESFFDDSIDPDEEWRRSEEIVINPDTKRLTSALPSLTELLLLVLRFIRSLNHEAVTPMTSGLRS